jgi:YggT family protein
MFIILLAIDLYSLVLFAAMILSWLDLSPDNPLVRIVRQLTEPVLRPLRGVLPAMGGVDFSPMVVLLGLRLLKTLISSV